ncbi:helix-turn-helix transcriptional regulator [Puniceicoccaceae bacterium K14]|nr:helix-turn-helix transcriptional regulator [Puniceicoccaceae bacterium K14]
MVNSIGQNGQMIRTKAFTRNFQTIPRRFDGLCLREIGYFPKKTEPTDRTFFTLNFSIILSGSGFAACDGERFAITSPCVFTQLPGKHMVYGPNESSNWEELYLILPAEKLDPIFQKRLIGETRTYWPIRNATAVLQAIRALLPIVEGERQQTEKVDLIDHLCERVIMETLLPGEPSIDAGSAAVNSLTEAMAAAPEKNYDYRGIAKDNGVSYSTFQRKWKQRHSVPPAQYLLNLRISECCRLIAETELKLAEIGYMMGFDDPAYYSRVFKKRIGMSPSEYRDTHKLSDS